MTDQVTSVEQSKRLIELGVPAEKASMVWHTMPAVIGRSKLRIAEEEHVGWMCRNFPGQYAPAFTVADYYPCSLTQKVHFTSISPNVTRDGM